MSEFHFGVGSERINDETGEAIDAIAREHDATFIWVRMPEGWRYWFSTRNYGAPFDQQTASAVYAALDEAEANGDVELPSGLRAKVAA